MVRLAFAGQLCSCLIVQHRTAVFEATAKDDPITQVSFCLKVCCE